MADERSYYEKASELAKKTSAELPRGPGPMRGLPMAKLLRFLRAVLIALVVLFALVYAVDAAVYEYKVSNNAALGSVQVDLVYAIEHKGGKTEFDYQGTETEPCVKSVFPHGGHTPCWWARRHTEKQVNL